MKQYIYNPITKELQFEDQTLPTSGKGWEENREYREGVDFVIKTELQDYVSKKWFVPYGEVVGNCANKTRQVAVLIEKPEAELTKEKEEILCLKVENIETGEKDKYGRVKVIGNLRIEASKEGEGEEKEEEKPSREWLKSIGFYELPHYTIMNSLEYDLPRNRKLSIGCLGDPNEMMVICEIDPNNCRKVTDLVVLHNWDYDGYLTKEKVNLLLKALTQPK